MRAAGLACLIALFGPAVAVAQQARPSIFAIDSTAAIDETVDANGNSATGLVFDSIGSVEIGRGFQAIARPIVQRVTATRQWNRQIWIATLRYERQGAISLRADTGLIVTPIGLAHLKLRPHLNPTIAQPSSVFTRLPPLEVGAPRANLLGPLYPLGAVVTVSSARWDARAGIIDSSPLRPREVFARINPPRSAHVVAGGGVTPIIGLRVGVAIAHGRWLKAGEVPFIPSDRNATVATLETEFSFRHTKLAGEWLRDAVESTAGTLVASGWYFQGQQTLAPRWYVAVRVERLASPAVVDAPVPPDAPAILRVDRQHLNGVEETLGYRLTPDVTLRASHRARRGFGRPEFDHTAAVSVVFFRRWI